MRRVLERRDHLFGRRLRGSLGKRRDRGVENIDARFDGHHVAHRRQARGAVRMKMQRQRDPRFDFLDHLIGGVRRQQPAHVFQADNLHAHVGEFFGHAQKIVGGVDRTDRVANRAFDELAGFERRLDGGLHVADIVHGIEDAETRRCRCPRRAATNACTISSG